MKKLEGLRTLAESWDYSGQRGVDLLGESTTVPQIRRAALCARLDGFSSLELFGCHPEIRTSCSAPSAIVKIP
jgi:hypothetical protein